MTDEQIAKMAQHAQKVLQEAVREEMVRKSRLGQFAIVNRDGKPCRVPASEIVDTEDGEEGNPPD